MHDKCWYQCAIPLANNIIGGIVVMIRENIIDAATAMADRFRLDPCEASKRTALCDWRSVVERHDITCQHNLRLNENRGDNNRRRKSIGGSSGGVLKRTLSRALYRAPLRMIAA